MISSGKWFFCLEFTSGLKWLKGRMDLGLREENGQGILGLFVNDSNSGHKKIKRFEKNI